MTRGALWLAVTSTAMAIGAQPAHADFRVCNQFERRTDVAFGYVDRQRGWMAQGWYILETGECKVIYKPDLDNRYYYLFMHAAGGAMWTGDVPFCIRPKKFLLEQAQYGKNTPDDCHRAGLDYAQFFKVDVNGAKDHTYTIMANTNPGTPGGAPRPQQPPVSTTPAPQPYRQGPNQPPAATAPAQPPYQQTPQAPPPPPYQQPPQLNRPPVATAPAQPPYQPAPQAPPPQPYQPAPQPQTFQQPPQPPAQPPYQPAPQPYQPAPQAPMQQPYQPYRPAPQPQTYQQAPQQPAPPQAVDGGTACQRYPNLC